MGVVVLTVQQPPLVMKIYLTTQADIVIKLDFKVLFTLCSRLFTPLSDTTALIYWINRKYNLEQTCGYFWFSKHCPPLHLPHSGMVHFQSTCSSHTCPCGGLSAWCWCCWWTIVSRCSAKVHLKRKLLLFSRHKVFRFEHKKTLVWCFSLKSLPVSVAANTQAVAVPRPLYEHLVLSRQTRLENVPGCP